ncbi:MAG: hypothetical protein M1361_02575 [Patescibacteria group bacterium]|nr:hypothetical protein [Patescibacteria group bacterium]MCL5224460.1 hypothetical protein [Patescibacteria group bacterium]
MSALNKFLVGAVVIVIGLILLDLMISELASTESTGANDTNPGRVTRISTSTITNRTSKNR